MTRNANGHSNDLASDLLADLNQPLPIDRRRTLPSTVTALGSDRPTTAREGHSHPPAVEAFLRVGACGWGLPALFIRRRSATIRLGLMGVELGIRLR